MKRVLPRAEELGLREYYLSLSTGKLVEEANSDHRHLKKVLDVLETERRVGDRCGISIALMEAKRQEEKLRLVGEELRTRPEYDRTMLDF